MKFILFSCISLISSSWAFSADVDGKMLFTRNCSACHLLDQSLVGPSLVEIRAIYVENPDGFVDWCTSPGKKRAEAIEMPSMAHLGEENLLSIRKHIMDVSDGVEEKAASSKDPFDESPSALVRPRVQRIFMPDAGPAAIAVALDEKISLCWDAGVCRLRYVWSGGFIDGYPYWRGNGSRIAKLIGTVRYVEPESLFDGAVKFHGYDMQDGFPVFRYSAGDLEISESFKALPDEKGIERHFKIKAGPGGPLMLRVPPDPSVSMTSDHGLTKDGVLTISPDEATEFTLTLVFK